MSHRLLGPSYCTYMYGMVLLSLETLSLMQIILCMGLGRYIMLRFSLEVFVVCCNEV